MSKKPAAVAAKQSPKSEPEEVKALATVGAGSALVSKSDDSDFMDDAGGGLDTVTARDMLVPRLTILQQLSPQLNPKKPQFIEGAKLRDIVDVATGKAFPHGILFLPVLYRKEVLEWYPRDTGKGLAKIHSDIAILDTGTPQEKGPPILKNGNILVETAQFYGLNLTDDMVPCFIPMASTQLKIARGWVNMLTGTKLKHEGVSRMAPAYYFVYELTVAEMSNNQGDWGVWKVKPPTQTMKDWCAEQGENWQSVKAAAISLREAVISGKAAADVSGMDGGSSSSSDDDGAM